MRKHAFVLLVLFPPLVAAQLPPMGGAKRIQERARDLRDQSRQQQPPPPPPPRSAPTPASGAAPAYPTAKTAQPAVHKAASAGDLQQLKDLETQGNSLTTGDADQSTPLHLAAYRGNQEVVDYLLSRQGMLKDPVDKRGITPLMLAAGAGHTGIVESLLAAGCDAKLKAADGGTALHRAAAQGHAGVVDLLLKAGSDPVGKDGNGKTAADLATAKKKGEWETVVSRLKQTEP